MKLAALPFVLMTIVCWGVYGPVLHKGQIGLGGNRLAAFLCVGIAYFVVAIVIPGLLLFNSGEKFSWSPIGFMWALAGGTAGALGALGIILAFNKGGSPAWVMSLVFGCAPVISAFVAMYLSGLKPTPWFLAGLILIAAGAFVVTFTTPRGPAPAAKTAEKVAAKAEHAPLKP